MAGDRRVALVAVIVTGAVGIAAPLITWRATTDAQDAAGQDERARTDLAELRSVLDRSLHDLNRLQEAVQLELVAWQRDAPNQTYLRRHGASASIYSAARRNADRLQIRLGNRSTTYRSYSEAIGATFSASSFMYRHKHSPGSADEMAHKFNRGNLRKRAFQAEAHRLARSRLPSGG